jgi:hypothetical protein
MGSCRLAFSPTMLRKPMTAQSKDLLKLTSKGGVGGKIS